MRNNKNRHPRKTKRTETIRVPYLARVEGAGGLYIKLRPNRSPEVQLRIFEPPRLFEALLRGRGFQEAPDLTARICGICPVAYQITTVQAIEDAFGVRIPEPIRALRRLIYCGEWIESHSLHVFMLHAPDFLGYPDMMKMAGAHPEIVRRGLELKKTGNALMTLLGGREIHPVNIRVGGFYKVPEPVEFRPIAEALKRARDAASRAVRWAGALPFPDFQNDYEFVAMRHPERYAVAEGRLVSNKGLNVLSRDFESHFIEEQVPHSTALHSSLRERGAYLVGPMARFNLNAARLSPLAREAAREAGIAEGCLNPFQSIIVRCVEILHACEEALSIIENYERPARPAVEIRPRAGTGFSCTEAPRGTLYHRFQMDGEGTIKDVRIVPPTAQNQKLMEGDLQVFLRGRIHLPRERLARECEQAVRNYDPCISCSTHFLKARFV